MNRNKLDMAWVCVLSLALLACGPAFAAQDDAAASSPDETRIALLQVKPQAYAVVEAAGRHEQSRIRLAALEAVEFAPDAAFEMARSGMADENPAVRFASLVTVGKLKIERLADASADFLRDENASVRGAAIFALARCGRRVDLTPLANMLGSSSPGTRANAAMLIGQLGDRQAIEMLREMAAEPMPRVSPAERTWVRLQFAEAMIRLAPDDAEVLGSIRASVYSNLDDVRVLSIQILGEVRDKSVQGGLAHIIDRENPIQVKIAAAQSLARMGDKQGLAILLEASSFDEKRLGKELENYARRIEAEGGAGPELQAVRALIADRTQRGNAAAEVRAQAARALGWVNDKKAAQQVSAMLEDPDPIVRVAAAAAVLQATR